VEGEPLGHSSLEAVIILEGAREP
jgi:hypothetical protein